MEHGTHGGLSAADEIARLRGLLAEAINDEVAAEAESERLRKALVDHNDALRSAQQVAQRDGKDTNWLALRGRLTMVLAEHHAITNEARNQSNPATAPASS